MAFFDLSIPYMEKSGAPASDTRSRRDSRLRTAARAMELGYTAVAYDRPFRGVLADADRCQIVPFSAQSFLESVAGASLPAFTAAVALHRELLGVPRASPFRQYSRITVSVDSAAAASLLNSGNRLLRSYDIVATRPVNQMAFDQACNASVVDIISLNFSQKLPFRLKLPMVQAAIKRGVYFEISYSHLIADGHARRQILSEAKRLGEWTRGKNLIISGSATSFNDVRGPHDVANLSTVLLGLTMERAKAAISKNCRSLVVNALRKKDCYFKEAIRIEKILPDEKVDSQENWFKDWNDWDPISSAADDLPSLDDMAKLFSAANTHSKTQNSLPLTSSPNVTAPNPFLIPCANKHGLDFANARHPSSEIEHNNVDHVSMEASVMVAPNAANVEPEPCLDENSMAIDAFDNPSCAETLISGGIHSSLTGAGLTDDSVENTDQADAVLVFTETQEDAADLLDCSYAGTRDQTSVVDNGEIITVENHYFEKMVDSEAKGSSSSSDLQINDNSDMMEVHEQFVLLHEVKDLDEIGGQEQLSTGMFDDSQVKTKLQNQQGSTAADESTTVNLLDGATKFEMQVQTGVLCKKTNPDRVATKTNGKKKHVSAAKILGLSMQRLVNSDGANNGFLHESGKHSRFRRRSNHRGYLLPVKNLCKSMLFKKKARRLRREHRFL